MSKRILLSTPHMTGNERKYIDEAFDTNWVAPLGPNVDAFERDIASYAGVKAVSATVSGTAAIHVGLALLGVGKGDTVFVSSFTFIASANPVLYLGAEPVFIDSESETWNMSPEALERGLQEAKANNTLPKAIVVVHLYGQSAKMDELMDIANRYGVPILEDAAESLGSSYKGKKSGTHATLGIYSFNGNKIITTSGGGAIISNDEELIKKAKFLCTQAKDDAPYYQHSQIGYNYRMSNIVAGIGRAQLEVIDDRVNKRREVFEFYKAELMDVPGVELMPEMEETTSNRWLSTLTIDLNAYTAFPIEIMHLMDAVNIETRALWKPLHLQPLFEGCLFYENPLTDRPVSEMLFESGLCLPSGTNMTREDQYAVVNELKRVLYAHRKLRPIFFDNNQTRKETKISRVSP